MINDMIVGMENLPNVFIDKIQVFPSSIGIRVVLMLCMYDHKENPSWYGRNLDIKLKVLFESRQNEINALNNGDLSLHDVAPEVLPFETFGRVMIKDSASGTPTLMQGDYEKYTFVFERNLNRNEDLNVYAACFVDNTGFETHPVFSKYYGPMVAEQVFVGGQLNTLSNYFYYPDTNEEYGGPVHIKPDGSYMEGSVHSEEPHKDVRIVSEENYKIQAFNFNVGLAPDGVEDIGSFVDFLVTDRQAGSPPENATWNRTPRDSAVVALTNPNNPGGPQSNYSPQGPIIEDPNVSDSTPDRIY